MGLRRSRPSSPPATPSAATGRGRPLFDGFTGAFATYADRTAIIDAGGPVTYRQLDERSAHLARILLDLGFGPLDRIIVQLPNTALFGYLYFALQRIGAAPVLALPGHRRRAISQFAEISGHPAVLNVACVPYPDPVLGERMCACLVMRKGGP